MSRLRAGSTLYRGATVIVSNLGPPGKDALPVAARILGKPNHLIDANEEMWAFFRNFRR